MPLPLLSGTDLYDTIMGKIEPDLLSHNLERTKNYVLTAGLEERKEMAARYEAAFAEYDRQFAAYEKSWEKRFHTYKSQSMQSLEKKMKGGEKDMISSIEKNIRDSSL